MSGKRTTSRAPAVNGLLKALHGGLEFPTEQIPDTPLDPKAAYQMVHDEVMLDGNARMNLATFVTTWMPELATLLMTETLDKNLVDKDEYPATAELERRCVQSLASLWHAPGLSPATGTSTTGSSEAAMLGGLALKKRWQKHRKAAGKPTDKPNLIAGANVQVCWEKFCRYFDVEPRLIPIEPGRYHLTPEALEGYIDENTIGVVAILGSTFDGSYEDVAGISAWLDEHEKKTGLDIPIHVDAASGGFIAPFIDKDLEWDFRIKRVHSINSSGHKYGLVYPGVGWAIWRDREALPEELVFNVNYLGGDMPTFALNFSRPGAQVIAQYLMFLMLGIQGYTEVQQFSRDVATHLAQGVADLGPFELISKGDELPVFAAKLKDGVGPYTVFDISRVLRESGWLVPAYSFPENCQDLNVLRFVIRAGFTPELSDSLLTDLGKAVEYLAKFKEPLPSPDDEGFHH